MHSKIDIGCASDCCLTSCIRYLIVLQDTLQAIASIDIELIAHNQIDLLTKSRNTFAISHFLWRWKDLVLFLEIVCALAGSCNAVFASWFTCSKLICQFNCSITGLVYFWFFRSRWWLRLAWFRCFLSFFGRFQ